MIARCIEPLLASGAQVIVADGGSGDDTMARARRAGAQVLQSSPGRALQMNQGAQQASAPILLFLHADTELPADWLPRVKTALAAGAGWGRFDVRFDDPHPLLAVVAQLMNWRSRVSGIATGDQAIFVERALWLSCNGYAPIPLMEDIDLSRRLKRLAGAPACVRVPVITSARRWRRDGILRTILLMWWLRWRFFVGASPQALHAIYYGRRG